MAASTAATLTHWGRLTSSSANGSPGWGRRALLAAGVTPAQEGQRQRSGRHATESDQPGGSQRWSAFRGLTTATGVHSAGRGVHAGDRLDGKLEVLFVGAAPRIHDGAGAL